MTANKEILYWYTNEEWYNHEDGTDVYELTDKAPDRAKRSFEMWKERKKKHL